MPHDIDRVLNVLYTQHYLIKYIIFIKHRWVATGGVTTLVSQVRHVQQRIAPTSARVHRAALGRWPRIYARPFYPESNLHRRAQFRA